MARATTVLAFLALALGACGKTVDPTSVADRRSSLVEPAAGPAEPPPQPLQWPDAIGCPDLVDRLLALDDATMRRLDPQAAPLIVAALHQGADGDSSGWLPRLEAPLESAGPCVLLVGTYQVLGHQPDRVLERRTVHSSYQTGTKRRRNPEHQALEKELAAARREAERGLDVLSTGDPLVDLIGMVAGSVIGGFDAVARRQELQELEARLDATATFIEDPILTPYRYEQIALEAERRFALPVALHDRAAGALWRTTVTLAETERFAVADDRHPKDAETDQPARSRHVTSAELEMWRRDPPAIDDRALLTHIAATARSRPFEAMSLEDAVAVLRSPDVPMMASAAKAASPNADPTSSRPAAESMSDAGRLVLPTDLPEPAAGDPSPVELRPLLDNLARVGADELAGFYVSSEHLLVPVSALGRSSLVAIRYADGMRAHGLVELVEDRLGVALVYLPRPAEALPLAAAVSAPPSTFGEPGVPWGTADAIFGLFIEDPDTGDRRWVDAPALQRFVARLDQL